MEAAMTCELCNLEASLYCASDSAFLCWNCDAKVHRANFLVARHSRRLLCSECKDFTGKQISGGLSQPVTPICRSCSPETPSVEDDSLSSSWSPSASVSSTESCATAALKAPIDYRCKRERIAASSSLTDVSGGNCVVPAASEKNKRRRNVGSRTPTAKVDGMAEEVFMNWSKRLGVKGNSVTSLASHALGFWLRKLTAVAPFRVAAATSFWFGLRFCGDRNLSRFQNLRRLEAISGVPAKLILAGEAKLARVVRERRARRELEEGWAESQSQMSRDEFGFDK